MTDIFFSVDDIDAKEQTPPTGWNRIKYSKKDTIRRCIVTGHDMAENFRKSVLLEREKDCVKRDVNESTSK